MKITDLHLYRQSCTTGFRIKEIRSLCIELATWRLPIVENGVCIGLVSIHSLPPSGLLERIHIDENFKSVGITENISFFPGDIDGITVIEKYEDTGEYLGFIKNADYIEALTRQQELEVDKLRNEVSDLNFELESILEHSQDGICLENHDTVILRYNSSIEHIEGRERKNIIGKRAVDLVREGVWDYAIGKKVLESGKVVKDIQVLKGNKKVASTGVPLYRGNQIHRILITVRDITRMQELEDELLRSRQLCTEYRQELNKLTRKSQMESEFIIRSPAMRKITETVENVAGVDSTVLIQGESGVGKGVIARRIHSLSHRHDKPFVTIDCGAIPYSLLETELFGYEKGAFTGALNRTKIGIIEEADSGTLFIDEIGELPLDLQVKLLQVLQNHEIKRVGSNDNIRVNIRVIAATNRRLDKLVQKGEFRKDLYYRLNVIPLTIPSLRKRKEDIVPLILHALARYNRQYNREKTIHQAALSVLENYQWPGNVRELENIIERLVVTTTDEMIGVEDLPEPVKRIKPLTGEVHTRRVIGSYHDIMDETERILLADVMKASNSMSEMANTLGIDKSTVSRKMKKHGLAL